MIQEILTYTLIIWAIYKLSKGIYTSILKKKSNSCASENCSHSCEGCALKTNFDYTNKIKTKNLL